MFRVHATDIDHYCHWPLLESGCPISGIHGQAVTFTGYFKTIQGDKMHAITVGHIGAWTGKEPCFPDPEVLGTQEGGTFAYNLLQYGDVDTRYYEPGFDICNITLKENVKKVIKPYALYGEPTKHMNFTGRFGEPGDPVWKIGAYTGKTESVLEEKVSWSWIDIHNDCDEEYWTYEYVYGVRKYTVEDEKTKSNPFCEPGDSGSLVWTDDHVIGVMIAAGGEGDIEYCRILPWWMVTKKFNIAKNYTNPEGTVRKPQKKSRSYEFVWIILTIIVGGSPLLYFAWQCIRNCYVQRSIRSQYAVVNNLSENDEENPSGEQSGALLSDNSLKTD